MLSFPNNPCHLFISLKVWKGFTDRSAPKSSPLKLCMISLSKGSIAFPKPFFARRNPAWLCSKFRTSLQFLSKLKKSSSFGFIFSLISSSYWLRKSNISEILLKKEENIVRSWKLVRGGLRDCHIDWSSRRRSLNKRKSFVDSIKWCFEEREEGSNNSFALNSFFILDIREL